MSLSAREPRTGPPPYPYGWFAAGFSHELRPGQLATHRWMGREIVVYRTKSGGVHAIEAYCPHLGAHLGGGTVDGENLRCPFHGFAFSTEGQCVSTPYGAPPPAAKLGRLPVREVCGVVMVWHGPPGQQPWEIEVPDRGPGWRALRTTRITLASHPQEVTENSVDVGHFSELHGFRNTRIVEPLSVDGPRLRTRYAFTRPVLGLGVGVEIHIRVDGLGFSLVELSMRSGWQLRQLVLTTPTGPRSVQAYVGTTVHSRGATPATRAAWAPVESVMERFVLRTVVREIRADQRVWDHKAYLRRPAIAAGDGPIGRYRAWAAQFYPNDSASHTSSPLPESVLEN